MTISEYYFVQELLKEIVELKARVAGLETENAYLDSIKDPLRDNLGWSPVSDLTFD
jgi:hypothetical protein